MAEATQSSLKGKRIVITRATSQSEALAKELSSLGAIPVVLPLIEFAEPEDFGPLDIAIAGLGRFDWLLFTSGQAVRAVVSRGQALGAVLNKLGSRLRIAAVGPVCAGVLRQAGLAVEYVAQIHSGVGLADELGERLRDRNVLLPRSDRANPDLPPALRRHGAIVTEVIAYRTLRPNTVDKQRLSRMTAGEADAVLFFSPSAVHNFAELLGEEKLRELQEPVAITAVGPVTAAALRQSNVERFVMAADTTSAAVVQALENHFSSSAKSYPAGAKRG